LLFNFKASCQKSPNYGHLYSNMKTIFLHFSSILIILGALVCGGCSTMSGDSGAYTLKQTKFDVETAMQRYRNANIAGSVTLAEQQNVTAAHNAYARAFHEAFLQARSNLNATTPPNVRQLADRLIAAIVTIPE
jgi:hypothetical protein